MLVVVLLLVLAVVYYLFDPSTSVFFPKCPFRLLTNLPCAGCGSQRAIHSLLHLDIKQALEYNVMVVVFLPILLILAVSSLFRTKYPRFYYILHHKYVAYTVFVVIMV